MIDRWMVINRVKQPVSQLFVVEVFGRVGIGREDFISQHLCPHTTKAKKMLGILPTSLPVKVDSEDKD